MAIYIEVINKQHMELTLEYLLHFMTSLPLSVFRCLELAT